MHANDFVRSFERNCPHVRISKDEREELHRLFWECWKDANKEAARKLKGTPNG